MKTEMTLAEEQEETFTARANLQLRLGNAGAVDVTVNGKPVAALGEMGQVVEKELKTVTTIKNHQYKIGFISLGCAKNQVDSEIMIARLKSAGYKIVSNMERADIVILNSCGFIEDARQESINAIIEADS